MEDGPVRISKRIVHRVIGFPTLDRPKTLKSDSREVIEEDTRAKLNK